MEGETEGETDRQKGERERRRRGGEREGQSESEKSPLSISAWGGSQLSKLYKTLITPAKLHKEYI